MALDVLQSESGNLGLATLAFLPTLLRTFVATDMNIRRGEYVHNLVDDILGKLQGEGLAGTHHLANHAEVAAYVVRTSGASQLRISCQCRLDVSGHVHFGNYSDVAFGCIAHDVTCLVLCVIS